MPFGYLKCVFIRRIYVFSTLNCLLVKLFFTSDRYGDHVSLSYTATPSNLDLFTSLTRQPPMITGGAGPTILVLDNSITSLFLWCGVSLLIRHQELTSLSALFSVLLDPNF